MKAMEYHLFDVVFVIEGSFKHFPFFGISSFLKNEAFPSQCLRYCIMWSLPE